MVLLLLRCDNNHPLQQRNSASGSPEVRAVVPPYSGIEFGRLFTLNKPYSPKLPNSFPVRLRSGTFIRRHHNPVARTISHTSLRFQHYILAGSLLFSEESIQIVPTIQTFRQIGMYHRPQRSKNIYRQTSASDTTG